LISQFSLVEERSKKGTIKDVKRGVSGRKHEPDEEV